MKWVRTALYVPAINARALEKARGLDVDMLIIDLEDAVPLERKAEARIAAVEEVAKGFAGKLVAIRFNGLDSPELAADIAAAERSLADCFVLPKVEVAASLDAVVARLPNPVLAMIEGPLGLYNAREIAAHKAVAGLIAGVNDICADMGIRPGPNREGLELALQTIVLAGAAAGKPTFDGVNNKLDDMSGLEAECGQGRCYGYTGKTLIHPNQVAIANAAFGPTPEDVAEAEALIAASTGGAQRYKGKMIESMHVEEARRTIERSRHTIGS
ncbi:MAG: CoA ester lyase [Sphingomonadales bacterium]|nr:CoA ester lyase [Sphingomonadales bacterium]